MKAIYYFFGFTVLTMASCSSGLYVGSEYDDLYYQNSDKPVTRVVSSINQPVPEGNLRSGEYFNNIYANDTLVSDEYSKAVDSSLNNGGVNNYYLGSDTYAGRLRSFYGNYFDPYWRDPFYMSMYPSLGFGFYSGFPYYSGYPYYNYYDPFYYDMYSPYSYGYSPFYYGYSPFYFGYRGLFGGYYGGFYGGYGYPYYGYGYGYGYNDFGGVKYGRRERPSTVSSRWAGSTGGSPAPSGSTGSRRGTGIAGTSGGVYSGNSVSQVASGERRGYSSSTGTQNGNISTGRRGTQDPVVRSGNSTIAGSRSSGNTSRPLYNSANRSYTPSYSNPRMSTRPSYNNTRVNSGSGFYNSGSFNRVNSGSGTIRSGSIRSGSSFSSPRSYSAPVRSSVSRSYSSPSFNSGGNRSSSFSSGSVSRGSSSFSSGSSSHSSSGGGSSSGHRR